MPKPPIMAMKITPESYSLATAILPEIRLHSSKILGLYLILNERTTLFYQGKAHERLKNSVATKEELEMYYDIVELGKSISFSELEPKLTSED